MHLRQYKGKSSSSLFCFYCYTSDIMYSLWKSWWSFRGGRMIVWKNIDSKIHSPTLLEQKKRYYKLRISSFIPNKHTPILFAYAIYENRPIDALRIRFGFFIEHSIFFLFFALMFDTKCILLTIIHCILFSLKVINNYQLKNSIWNMNTIQINCLFIILLHKSTIAREEINKLIQII